MKMKICLAFCFALAACHPQAAAPPPCPASIDTTSIHARMVSMDSLRRRDSVTVDSLRTQLFLARYTMEKVKFYVGLCIKKPAQEKFLKGWVRRAVGI